MALIVCGDCDKLHLKVPLPEGAQAKCTRCGALLYRHPVDSLNRTLALAIAGLILFVVSNLHPFLTMKIQGQEQQTVLFTGIMELYKQGLGWLALLVFLTIFLLPLLELTGLIYLLLPLKLNRIPKNLPLVFRTIHVIHHWSMMDVFMLGILVSMVKLASMAEVLFGPAFYTYMVLIFILSATIRSFSPEAVWKATERLGGKIQFKSPSFDKDLISCHCCGMVCGVTRGDQTGQAICPRCHASLHRRKPGSLERTWALTIAAFLLYLPANVFSISKITTFAGVQTDTIISSVIYFFKSGMIPIALVILTASILVPLFKLIILIFLLISVQIKMKNHLEARMTLYRITEAIGRWSMVDVYVVTVLVALVKLGAIAYIEAGPGIVFFAAVVIITMIAAMSFDPRLIWDAALPIPKSKAETTNQGNSI